MRQSDAFQKMTLLESPGQQAAMAKRALRRTGHIGFGRSRCAWVRTGVSPHPLSAQGLPLGSSLQASLAQLPPAAPFLSFPSMGCGPTNRAVLWVWASCPARAPGTSPRGGQQGHSHRRVAGRPFPSSRARWGPGQNPQLPLSRDRSRKGSHSDGQSPDSCAHWHCLPSPPPHPCPQHLRLF